MTRRGVIIALIVLLLGAGAVLASIRLLATEKVVYLDVDATSSAPFTPPAVFTSDSPAPPAPVDPSVALTTPTIPENLGDNPGPVGGTVKAGDCDPELLIQFLNANPDRLEAWLGASGVLAGDFEDYVRSAPAAVTTRATRVTNFGFRNGKAVQIQSILASGTTVLVDDLGEIAIRCQSGSPLKPPKAIDNYKCDGCPSNLGPTPPCNQTCYELQAGGTTTGAPSTTTTTPAASSTTTSTTKPATSTTARSGTSVRTPTTRRGVTTTRRTTGTQAPVTATFFSTQPSTFPPAATAPPSTIPITQATAPTIPPQTFPTAATTQPPPPTTPTTAVCLPILGCVLD